MWFWLAFSASIIGSIDVILNKHCLKKVSGPVLTWALFALPLPFLLYFVIKAGIPSFTQLFYVGAIGSSIAFVFSKTITNGVYKKNDLSKIFPLTSFAGIFNYVLGLLFLSETIRPIPLLGLFTVIIGSYVLNLDQAKEDFLKPFKVLFTNKTSLLFLFSMLLNSLTSIFDKIGINNTQPINPIFVLCVENICMSIYLTIYLWKREQGWFKDVKKNIVVLSINSAIYQVMSLLVFFAFSGGPVALVMGIKRLQIFFILLLSYFFFKDKPEKRVWFASFIMALGVLLIKLG